MFSSTTISTGCRTAGESLTPTLSVALTSACGKTVGASLTPTVSVTLISAGGIPDDIRGHDYVSQRRSGGAAEPITTGGVNFVERWQKVDAKSSKAATVNTYLTIGQYFRNIRP